MGRRLPYTPNGKIKAALRMLSMRSRERAAAMKAQNYTCQGCGAKQSRAKGKEVYVEAHHKQGILNWDELYKAIRKYLLVAPEHWEILCHPCHEKSHLTDRKGT